MIEEVEYNYLICLFKYHNKEISTTYGFNRLLIILKIIETENRSLIWRIGEYSYLIFEFIFSCKGFHNVSIGTYQIKISHILDYLGKKYVFCGTYIVPESFKVKDLYSLFAHANKSIVAEYYIKKHVRCNQWDKLNFKDIENIAKIYSGCKNFECGLNYFTVLFYLYYGESVFLDNFIKKE